MQRFLSQPPTTTCWILLCFFTVQAVSASPFPEAIQNDLARYCLDCHSGDEPSGDINLATPESVEAFFRQGRDWVKVLRVLEQKEMPPAEADQPSAEVREALWQAIDKSLVEAAQSFPINPGKVTLRRLNRTEYNNTIRDLLGIDSNPASELPSDPTGYGFDNIGDVLFIPPVLMEKYLDITKQLLAEVFADEVLRARLVTSEPTDSMTPEAAAREVLSRFMPLAFRRPVEPAEIESRMRLFREAIERGDTYDESLQVAVSAVLLAPSFLMKLEVDPPTPAGAHRISDHELAVRLSYFLWSTMPDSELRQLADEGKLHDPAVLAAQVDRMIADPRSIALAENFAAQWLRFREMLDRGVDFRAYPEFNDHLRDAMYQESFLFFDHLLRQNRSVLEILNADYTFLNERLAKHYGIDGVSGKEMRLVPLTDRRRGGVLGMGSLLTVTSFPTRTSPVLRGKWVLEELFGAPPPPPPANVGSLSATKTDEEHKTLRKRLEAHRAQESCASCHKQMDPIGFGLENFDGIGKWRDQEENEPIDNVGELPGGLRFAGPAELKDVLMTRRRAFLRTMVEKMFTYAVGRPVEAYDERAVREILARMEADDNAMTSLVQAIVASRPFQYAQNDRSTKEQGSE